MKQVKIMSRLKAAAFSTELNIPSCVIISIYSTDETPNKFCTNDKIKDILNICFNDTENSDSINKEQAIQISEFVKYWVNNVDLIVVHCDSGVSRSAGVGAAIMKWAENDDFEIFNNRLFRPNMRCYHYVLESLMAQ
jgi:predicted protein tyrosine phosphatase